MRLAPAARLARAPSPARRASLVGAALLLGVAACDPPNAPDRVRLRPLVAAGNSCGGFAPAQIPGAAGLDPTSEEALTLWRNYLLTERVNGYLPAGVYTIRNYWHVPGYDNVPFLTFWPEWTDRGPRTICGDGDATVIKLDLSASPERDLEIGVYIMSTNATVRDLKLEGTSYSSAARAEWKGGTAVMVSNADYVRVTNLTIDNWGHNGRL